MAIVREKKKSLRCDKVEKRKGYQIWNMRKEVIFVRDAEFINLQYKKTSGF
jgi:hypothetical protein